MLPSLTLEINDIDDQVSDRYTANSTESLHSRYSQRYGPFQGEIYPVAACQFFLRSFMQ
ncbi:hypothetical protein [Microcystis aeruginosa]|uniref:hypothetical protein n=1 Tax=Microcystis aeruginosa TaxID=1126 RepID=UPI0020A600AD|nr:hypothetical protein [Microcystis aeruginosa]